MALEAVPSMSPLVVVAHDDPGTADSLRHAVETAAGWQVVVADPTPAGLAAGLATGPAVALVGCAALAHLPAGCRTPVVAVGDDDRPADVRAALAVEARSLLAWPDGAADLPAELARVAATGHPHPGGAVGLVVATRGVQGGAGTTTVATHLAAAWARWGPSPVLLVDLAGGLAFRLDLDAAPTWSTIAPRPGSSLEGADRFGVGAGASQQGASWFGPGVGSSLDGADRSGVRVGSSLDGVDGAAVEVGGPLHGRHRAGLGIGDEPLPDEDASGAAVAGEPLDPSSQPGAELRVPLGPSDQRSAVSETPFDPSDPRRPPAHMPPDGSGAAGTVAGQPEAAASWVAPIETTLDVGTLFGAVAEPFAGLAVLPLAGLVDGSPDPLPEPWVVQHVLEFARTAYRLVVLDLPATDGPAIQAALFQADALVAVGRCETAGVRGLMAALAGWKAEGHDPDTAGAVVTGVRPQAPLAPREVRAALGDQLWALIPGAAAELAAAAEDGVLLLDRHDLPAVQAMLTLANQVVPFEAVST